MSSVPCDQAGTGIGTLVQLAANGEAVSFNRYLSLHGLVSEAKRREGVYHSTWFC
jgi:hypothetical protein